MNAHRSRMTFGLAIFMAIGLATLLTQERALADDPPGFFSGWQVSGRNSFHSEYYDTDGDPANSSYAHKFGQFYNDLSINVSKQFSPFHQVRGNMAGVINDSKYRYDRHGITLERFNLTQEQGETAMPYRAEVGDTYGFFTPRTLQRSLKGGQAEFQPGGRFFGARNTIQLVAGDGSARDYRDSLTEDTYYGASWLLQWDKTALSVNWAGNKTQSDPSTQTASLQQGVGGVALNHLAEAGGQHLEVDAELTTFNGNPAGTGSAAEANDRRANAFFFRLSGRSTPMPLTYTFKYEDYGQGYQPKGASVSQDRRTIDANLGWQFQTGLSLRLRRQYYKNSQATANPTDTNVFGATLSGALPTRVFPDLNMNLDGFVNNVEDRSLTAKTENRSLNASFNATLVKALTGGVRAGYQETVNELTGDKTSITRSLGFNLGHPVRIETLTGSISAGMTYRSVDAPNNGDNREPGFTLGLNLRNGSHQFDLSAYYRDYRPLSAGHVLTQGGSAAYTYSFGAHSIRLDGSLNQRDPDLSLYTTDYKVALTYDYAFSFPGTRMPEAPDASAPSARTVPEPAVPSLAFTGRRISGLVPGATMDQAEGWLEKAGIGSGVTTGNTHVYETRFFDTVYQRQRLAIITDAGNRISVAGVVVDIEATGTPETLEQLYDELRAVLARRYGAPQTYEQGEFGPNFFNEVNNGTFIRNTEWFTPSGIVRLGIPRRLDRQVRIEVQIRREFPGQKDTLWSMEPVR